MDNKILVIDEDIDFCDKVKNVLDFIGGYSIFLVTDPINALTKALLCKPDLIFINSIMKNRDGFDIVKEFGAYTELKHVPVVYLADYIKKEEVYDNNGLIGGNFFMPKPLDIDVFLNAIDSFLLTSKV